jgi:hypothetical protein
MFAQFLNAISGNVRTHNMNGVFFHCKKISKEPVAATVQFHDKMLDIG